MKDIDAFTRLDSVACGPVFDDRCAARRWRDALDEGHQPTAPATKTTRHTFGHVGADQHENTNTCDRRPHKTITMKNTSTTEARNNHGTQFEDNSHQHHHPEVETAPPDLDGLLRRVASDKTSTLPALDLLLPNEALTLENVAAMFEQFGWPAHISGERILLRVGIALQDRSEHMTVRCKRFPSGLRFFWDWYIRRDAKLVEKLRFVNEVNVGLSGVGMNYLGAPTNTPESPGVGGRATPERPFRRTEPTPLP